MTERAWTMRRLDTGDYLLPANSVKTTDRYYRLRRWTDGPHLGAQHTRTVWSLFVIYGYKLEHMALEVAPWESPEWHEVGEYPTRAAAIEAAIAHDESAA